MSPRQKRSVACTRASSEKPGPSSDDLDLDRVRVTKRTQPNGPVVASVLDRVVHDREQRALERRAIGSGEHRARRLDAHHHPARGGSGADPIAEIAHELARVERLLLRASTSARAAASSSSISSSSRADSRAMDVKAARYSSLVRSRRSASSVSARSTASGARSSCDASATKRRSRENADCSRSSMRSKDAHSRPSSSLPSACRRPGEIVALDALRERRDLADRRQDAGRDAARHDDAERDQKQTHGDRNDRRVAIELADPRVGLPDGDRAEGSSAARDRNAGGLQAAARRARGQRIAGDLHAGAVVHRERRVGVKRSQGAQIARIERDAAVVDVDGGRDRLRVGVQPGVEVRSAACDRARRSRGSQRARR